MNPIAREIEQRIVRLDPHAIVVGLGPSADFLRHVSKELLGKVRLFGVNDAFKFIACDDLVLMDPPTKALAVGSQRFNAIYWSDPKRIWCYTTSMPMWKDNLREHIRERVRPLDLNILNYAYRYHPKANPFLTKTRPYDHIMASPCGTTTLAWNEGNRRIGVIGVDLLHGNHHLSTHAQVIHWFFDAISRQALQLGGEIACLSPFSSIQDAFHPCLKRLSASSSAPTSEWAAPNESSSIRSASTAPSRSRSPGCEPAIPASARSGTVDGLLVGPTLALAGPRTSRASGSLFPSWPAFTGAPSTSTST